MSIYSNGGCIGKFKTYADTTPFPIRSTPDLVLVGQTSQQIAASTATTTQISFGSIPIAVGDLVIVAYASGSSVSRTINVTSGFTTITNLYGNDTHDVNFYVGSTFLTDLVTPYYVSATGATTDSGVIIVSVWRYANPTTPIDTTVSTSTGVNTRVPVFSAVTPTNADTKILTIVAGSLYTTTYSYTNPGVANFISAKSSVATTYRCEIALGWIYSESTINPSPYGSTVSTYDSYVTCAFPIRSNLIKYIGINSGLWNLQTVHQYFSY